MADIGNPDELRGKKLIDPSGGDIGEVQEVYLDHQTDRPEFALVNTGLLGRNSTFVPLAGASLDGPRIWVEVDKGQVSDAPKFDPEAELSLQQEEEIYRHYGISHSGSSDTDGGERADAGAEATGAAEDPSRETTDHPGARPVSETKSPEPTTPGTAPHEPGKTAEAASSSSAGTTAPVPDDSRSEQGLPRLRRYVVTEEVDVKVPVQHEEVRVEPSEPQTGEGQDLPEQGRERPA